MRFERKPLAMVAMLVCALFTAHLGGVVTAAAATLAQPVSVAVASQLSSAAEGSIIAEASATVPAGTDVAVEVGVRLTGKATETVRMAFAQVDTSGTLVLAKMSEPLGPSDGSFAFANSYWYTSFTGSFTGTATVTLPYDPQMPPARAALLMVKAWKSDGTGWQDASSEPSATLNVDTTNHAVTFETNRLASQFALAEPVGANRSTRVIALSKMVTGYNAVATVVAKTVDASGVPLPDKAMRYSVSRDKVSWSKAATMTPVAGKPGTYSVRVKPLSGGRTFVRVACAADFFSNSSSAIVTIMPKVYVSWPGIAPSPTRTTTLSGSIKPAHRAKVVLELKRWGSRSTQRIYLTTTSTGRWSKRWTFPRGTWMLRVVASADTYHSSSASVWRTLYVK